jgi:hypothetical protein
VIVSLSFAQYGFYTVLCHNSYLPFSFSYRLCLVPPWQGPPYWKFGVSHDGFFYPVQRGSSSKAWCRPLLNPISGFLDNDFIVWRAPIRQLHYIFRLLLLAGLAVCAFVDGAWGFLTCWRCLVVFATLCCAFGLGDLGTILLHLLFWRMCEYVFLLFTL